MAYHSSTHCYYNLPYLESSRPALTMTYHIGTGHLATQEDTHTYLAAGNIHHCNSQDCNSLKRQTHLV